MLFKQRISEQQYCPSIEYARQLNTYFDNKRALYEEVYNKVAVTCHKGFVLELCSGRGFTGLDIVTQNQRLEIVTPIDNDIDLKIAKENTRKHHMGNKRQIVKINNGRWPFLSNGVDGVVSTNTLHIWDDPIGTIYDAWRVLKPSGYLLINDLRRDADEDIAEYIVREMKGDTSVEGEFAFDRFIRSWRASYTLAEVEDLLNRTGIPNYNVAEHGAMAMSIEMTK